MLKVLRKSAERKRAAERLCSAAIMRARTPEFYARLGVADTLDGRFDLVVLHAWLVLGWLGAAGHRDLAQALVDVLFVSFDESLRELGAGDMSMGRKMKAMADAFYGRMQAYDAAADFVQMEAAILRNVYRGEGRFAVQARSLADYALRARAQLQHQPPDSDAVDFGPLPADEGSAT